MNRRLGTLALTLFAFGCSASGLGDPTGSACPTTQTLTYENFGADFMDTYCNDCHDFGTQANVQARQSDIDRAAAAGPDATNDYMPEGDSITQEERTKLGEWLACGAP